MQMIVMPDHVQLQDVEGGGQPGHTADFLVQMHNGSMVYMQLIVGARNTWDVPGILKLVEIGTFVSMEFSTSKRYK